MRKQLVRPIRVAATIMALPLFWFCAVSGSLAREYLTPDLLAMPRQQISLKGTDFTTIWARI